MHRMPELPEVESVVRRLAPALRGRGVTAFESLWARQCSPTAAGVKRAVVGRRIESVSRRAKYIVMALDDGSWLLVHLKMSGRLEHVGRDGQEAAELLRHIRARFALDDGSTLLFDDARKFGRIAHTRDLAAATAHLGIEPLSDDFTVDWLRRGLEDRSRQLKPLLLDQSFIAGLGNIYVDESLHMARLHPLTPSDRVKREQVPTLHAAIRAVLSDAIERNGTSFDWIYPDGQMQDHLLVYGRAGELCRTCRTTIEALRIGQRGTHICPRCQRRSNGTTEQRNKVRSRANRYPS